MFQNDALYDYALRKIFSANITKTEKEFANWASPFPEFSNWVSQVGNEPTFTQPVWGANFAKETKAPV